MWSSEGEMRISFTMRDRELGRVAVDEREGSLRRIAERIAS